MSEVEIVRQHFLKKGREDSTVRMFGKGFVLAPISDRFRVVLHEDFPMITEKDINNFVAYSIEKDGVVISGCEATVHPYRVMYIDEEGYNAYLASISQSIRGNRHCYPNVYQFIPALVSIPPHTPVRSADNPEDIEMYIMPAKKLLDSSVFLERLLILSIQRGQA